ncbi:MAG: GntR family transcriptional regulator [Rhodospirillales bacterium]|nr:GntR family transcriptional regulator [Rhodospirillales bacterium]
MARPAGIRASDTAYRRIKEWIVGGRIAPNAPIDEMEAARELGVSRTPVREALLRLKAEGLVEIARGRGIRVLPLSAQDMRAMYQVITGLEVTAAHLLAERRPDAAMLAPLEAATVAMEQAEVAGDDAAWGGADEAFHRALLDLSGNPYLRETGFRLRDGAQRAHLVAVRLQPWPYKSRSAQHHRALIAAILTGDPAIARAEHFTQRQRGEQALVAIVEKYALSNL